MTTIAQVPHEQVDQARSHRPLESPKEQQRRLPAIEWKPLPPDRHRP